MDWTLEMIVVPVSDIDRSKTFYVDLMGFVVDVDVEVPTDGRIVQLTPPGSGCSVTLMRRSAAGSLQGLYLVVPDIGTAREVLVNRGLPAGELYHWVGADRVPGADPQHRDYGTYLDIVDPDGNGWLLQEVPSRGASG